mgnify:CR=1 FL=1
MNSSICQCLCLCPPSFTGTLCQIPIVPVNRTYPGQIIVPFDRHGGMREREKTKDTEYI